MPSRATKVARLRAGNKSCANHPARLRASLPVLQLCTTHFGPWYEKRAILAAVSRGYSRGTNALRLGERILIAGIMYQNKASGGELLQNSPSHSLTALV